MGGKAGGEEGGVEPVCTRSAHTRAAACDAPCDELPTSEACEQPVCVTRTLPPAGRDRHHGDCSSSTQADMDVKFQENFKGRIIMRWP